MKKILIFLLLVSHFFALKVSADDVDFSVTPILESGQTLTNQTISAKYHAQQTLVFKLTNHVEHEITLHIRTAIPDLDSEGNQFFSSCNTFLEAPETVTLPANGSETITIFYNYKSFINDFDGEIANAILFSQDDMDINPKTNSINYLINVRKNDNQDTENIMIEKTEATHIDNECFVRVLIKNDSNAWLNQVTVIGDVLSLATEKTETHYFPRMAPNSRTELLIPITNGFKIGSYTTNITVKTGKKSWQLKSQFNLTEAQIDRICDQKIPFFTDKNIKVLYYVAILVGLLIVTIIFQYRIIKKNTQIS